MKRCKLLGHTAFLSALLAAFIAAPGDSAAQSIEQKCKFASQMHHKGPRGTVRGHAERSLNFFDRCVRRAKQGDMSMLRDISSNPECLRKAKAAPPGKFREVWNSCR